MTVINWCRKKIRRACAACKRVICCGVGGGGNDEMDLDHVYHLTVRGMLTIVRVNLIIKTVLV